MSANDRVWSSDDASTLVDYIAAPLREEVVRLTAENVRLREALRDARKCVAGCDWSDVEDLVPVDQEHELHPHDGNELLERIDSLLSEGERG